MAYTNFTNCTEEEYTEIIYSQDDKNRIRIWFNDVELEDAGEYCESFSGTNRILPNDGSKRFTLSNFIAKEYTLILRDLPSNILLEDQVKISIGTLVDEENEIYEDVPIGIFNIQDTPETDQKKVTIKLRDNRVKFDFNYDAKPLMDEHGGKASYKQLLNDMCTKAGVINDITTFYGENIEVSIYDNSIKATTYVSYIIEQAGGIPIITREGHLNCIYLNNLKTWQIPLSLVEKYEIGTPYTIQRVVYESGIIKYETSSDDTLETLYLDSANTYIFTQEQIDNVFNILQDFTIDSVETGKILGNPAIDPYDLIEVYGYYEYDAYENIVFVPDKQTVVFRTLANNTYSFNGVHRNLFDTKIGKEERKENVIKSSDESFKNWARTEINNLNSEITITAGKVDTIQGIVVGTYTLTDDETFQENKVYYVVTTAGNYIEYTDYEVGDTIPPDTIYELTGSIIERVEENNAGLQEQINENSNKIEQFTIETSSQFTQTNEAFEFALNNITNVVNQNNEEVNLNIEEIKRYLRYENGILTLGVSNNPFLLRLRNDRIYFEQNGNEVAYISNNTLYITDGHFLNQLRIGNFAFIPRANGSLGFRKVV